MESSKEASQKAPDLDGLSPDERAAIVEQWRKNRADLKWKPLEGRELERFLPFWNKVAGIGFGIVMVAGAIVIVLLFSAPREVEEVTGWVLVAGKPDAEGNSTVVVSIPGEAATQMTYRGKKRLQQGQKVVLEATVSSFTAWKKYRFKHPPEADS